MSKKAIADQEVTIKDSLFEFVRTHTTNADLTLIDDIVLSYVIAILEDVSSDPVFNVEGKSTCAHSTHCTIGLQISAK